MNAKKVLTNSTPMIEFGDGGRDVWTTASVTLQAISATSAASRAYSHVASRSAATATCTGCGASTRQNSRPASLGGGVALMLLGGAES